jgi:hypothetical protein
MQVIGIDARGGRELRQKYAPVVVELSARAEVAADFDAYDDGQAGAEHLDGAPEVVGILQHELACGVHVRGSFVAG